jgi:hypothetical protein
VVMLVFVLAGWGVFDRDGSKFSHDSIPQNIPHIMGDAMEHHKTLWDIYNIKAVYYQCLIYTLG